MVRGKISRSRGESVFTPAFTLVELLVVIGVIAVLIALLMPTLARAREEAFKIRCQSNCRQLVLAAQQYVNDNQTYLPFPNWGGGSPAGWLWGGALPAAPPPELVSTGTIYPYLENVTVYHCPKDDPPYVSGPSEFLTSWLMNGSVCSFAATASDGGAAVSQDHRFS